MRILVLGGTAFVGRAIVADALRAGADVELFGRGRTGAELFPGVRRLIGDRDGGDYEAVRKGAWDAVVDVSGYLPRHVGQAMDVLGDRVGRYLFISSHAVYAKEGVGPGSDEDTPRVPPERGVRATAELDQVTYGRSKVACEDDVLARYGERATIVRPGKVAGPHDPSEMSRTGCGGPRAAGGWRCRATRSSPCRWSTPATWPGWWSGCWRTAGPGPSPRSARPSPSRSAA